MAPVALPRFAVIAAGEMGTAVAKRLARAGCTVYTNLDGRSEATRQRAKEAGMLDAPLDDIVVKANWILSILPPRDAVSFAEKIQNAATNQGKRGSIEPLVFVDCNAVSPETVKRIAGILTGTGIRFIDAGIVGGPPRDGFDPTIYASAVAEDGDVLDAFVALSKYGLKIFAVDGRGCGSGSRKCAQNVICGEHSSVPDDSGRNFERHIKGITKGTIGVYTTMILGKPNVNDAMMHATLALAAHASSPTTAEALIKELSLSQAEVLNRLVKTVPRMLPKAYRWAGEMEEIGEFVGGKEGDIYRGLARLYERVEKSLDGDQADVEVMRMFVEDAKRTQK